MQVLSQEHLADLGRRRSELKKILGDRVLLLVSAYEKVRNNDVYYAFRQSSDFTYLTGFPEPDSIAVFDGASKENFYSLYVRPRDKSRELWDGKRFGKDGALASFDCDCSLTLEALDESLAEQISGREVELWVEDGHPLQSRLQELVDRYAQKTVSSSIRRQVNAMRLVKSEWEVDQMLKASNISTEAHHNLMKAAPAATYEYELEAELDYTCRRRGAKHQAYGAIVGNGSNACCLHYVFNDAKIDHSQLVLVDAGAEVNGYAADITRTFPASGRFTRVQQELYELVLKTQKRAIELVRPGVSMSAIHRQTSLMLAEGLIEKGYYSGSPQQVVDNGLLHAVYPHGTGHQLGLDVHDVAIGRDEPLSEGMVVTIEPGLYFQPEDDFFPKEVRGIGIRIEDNILVTEGDPQNLTKHCVKEVADIEKLILG